MVLSKRLIRTHSVLGVAGLVVLIGACAASATTDGSGGATAAGGDDSFGGVTAGGDQGMGGTAGNGGTAAGTSGMGGVIGGTGGISGTAGASGSAGASGTAGASGSSGANGGVPPFLPCDIYAAQGTTCVAAHSTTRALFGAYAGKLYQVVRASDHATTDIGTLTTGGYADSAAQVAFCANTTCIITTIYDQSSQANHLTISSAGGAAGPDVGADASALPAMAGGHPVFGVYVKPGTGYRNVTAKGTARNGQPEGMYMVTSGKHVNDGCCFDYGNTEQPLPNDTGNGHMDAVYFGTRCEHPPCSGGGPWIAADLENGLFQGNGSNTANATVNFDVVTALLKNDGQKIFALKTGNAQAGELTTQYNGTLPTAAGYIPMSQEGGIVLGVGGDNSHWSAGDFYEGVMTYGYPTDAADAAVQANITSVGYVVPKYLEVLKTSETTAQTWKYTTATPPGSWNSTSFDDSAWQTGPGGFGTTGTPGAVIGTKWSSADIWLRRTFNPGNLTATQISNLLIRLHHDEDAEIYVNGVQAGAFAGYTSSYEFQPMTKAGESAIIVGVSNTLAVHCHQTGGGQYIDVGLSVLSL